MPVPIIVFTDLDGTLLDHETYDYAPAKAMLKRLRSEGVPLIMASSKTAAEVSGLRAELGFSDCPAIVENGAGLLPTGQMRPQGDATHRLIRAALAALPEALRAGFSGFSDWSVDELARQTGLDPEAAIRAQTRDFSEPGVFTGPESARREFLDALAKDGIEAQAGGRYLTLSFGASKADRMAEVAAKYGGATVATVALGDAPNDMAMLQAADYGVIVPNPGHAGLPPLPGEATGRIRRAAAPGPAGWADALSELLVELHAASV